jgi:hypothetical protein
VSVEGLERCAECGSDVEVYVITCPACGAGLREEKLKIFRRLRDEGSLTEAAFEVAEGLLEEGHQVPRFTAKGPRKQVTELTIDDLDQCPVWEFALDEEGEPGQDEETVRPRPELTTVDAADGLFVVSARFTAADGTVFKGYVTPNEGGNDLEFPTILSEVGDSVEGLFPIRVEALVPTTRGRLVSEMRSLR